MTLPQATPERLSAFSDAVFAVLITVLVLELRPPAAPTYRMLLSHWPTWSSYAMSYLFIAIVWINHHHLMRYAVAIRPRLIWFTFGHLLSVSLVPLATAWMAVSRFAAEPVSFYAAVFFVVNATYLSLIWELVHPAAANDAARKVRRMMRARSVVTLGLFGLAAGLALIHPLIGLGLCACCLLLYLRPEPPRAWS